MLIGTHLRPRELVPAIGVRDFGGCRDRCEKSNPVVLDAEGVVLQLMGLLVMMQIRGLLLRGIALQMMLPRVQHAATQGVQLRQIGRAHV